MLRVDHELKKKTYTVLVCGAVRKWKGEKVRLIMLLARNISYQNDSSGVHFYLASGVSLTF